MDHRRWKALWLAMLAAALIALSLPVAALAAPNDAPRLQSQGTSGAVQPDDRNLLSLPGIFTLRLGPGSSATSAGLRLPSTQVDLPALNATATVDGLTVNPRDGSYNWDVITVAQAQPATNEAWTVSGMQATVQGPAAGFSTAVSTRIDLHPNETTQAGASLTFGFDGTTKESSFAVADGSVQMMVGPATLTVEGIETGDGALVVDSAHVTMPNAEMEFRMDGFTLGEGGASWQSLAWYGSEFKLGEAVTFSDNLVVLPGAAADPSSGGATTTFAINAGDLMQTGGQLVLTYDQATGQPTMALRDGSMTLGASGWSLAVDGINTGSNGATVDAVTLTAQQMGVQAQVTGLATGAGGMTFDQARLVYLPAAAGRDSTLGGFELVVDSTDAGYIVSTTTLVPSATASSQP